MYCKNCGAQIDDNAAVCPKCGVAVNSKQKAAFDDAPSRVFGVLCFLIPLLGLILYLVWRDEYPLKAKSCGKGAIIGVVAYIVFVIILFVTYFILLFSVH